MDPPETAEVTRLSDTFFNLFDLFYSVIECPVSSPVHRPGCSWPIPKLLLQKVLHLLDWNSHWGLPFAAVHGPAGAVEKPLPAPAASRPALGTAAVVS